MKVTIITILTRLRPLLLNTDIYFKIWFRFETETKVKFRKGKECNSTEKVDDEEEVDRGEKRDSDSRKL